MMQHTPWRYHVCMHFSNTSLIAIQHINLRSAFLRIPIIYLLSSSALLLRHLDRFCFAQTVRVIILPVSFYPLSYSPPNLPLNHKRVHCSSVTSPRA